MQTSLVDPPTLTSATGLPPVTVLVCTRNRKASIAITIRSIMACSYPDFTLVVVDQSDDTQTLEAIGSFSGEPRLRYIYTSARGKSRAENLALSFIDTELVLLTDDDCEVPPNWIHEMVQPFLANPQLGVVFCNVLPGPHDSKLGFIPNSQSSGSFLVSDLVHWQTGDSVNIGIGAGMAIRRSTAETLNGFNMLFGPGSPFRSGDDTDFTLRALLAGYQVYRTTTVGVIHYGFRTYEQGRRLIRNNLYGLGGIHGQLLRRGHLPALRRYAAVWRLAIIKPALEAIIDLRVPRVLGRALWLTRGLLKGLLVQPPSSDGGLYGMPEG